MILLLRLQVQVRWLLGHRISGMQRPERQQAAQLALALGRPLRVRVLLLACMHAGMGLGTAGSRCSLSCMQTTLVQAWELPQACRWVGLAPLPRPNGWRPGRSACPQLLE